MSEFSLRDDVWLWNVLRSMEADDEFTRMVQRAVFFREKGSVLNLWKNRPTYHELRRRVMQKARITDINFGIIPTYEDVLASHLEAKAFFFEVPFSPVSTDAVLLYSEQSKKLTGKNLLDISRLVADLESIWKGEPQEFILVVGDGVAKNANAIRRQWIDFTAQWIRK